MIRNPGWVLAVSPARVHTDTYLDVNDLCLPRLTSLLFSSSLLSSLILFLLPYSYRVNRGEMVDCDHLVTKSLERRLDNIFLSLSILPISTKAR